MKSPKRKGKSTVTDPAIDAIAGARVIPDPSQLDMSANQHLPDPMVALPSNSTVKDAAALKTALMRVVSLPAVVALDVRSVERVDTATMQLLCAFVRDRAAHNLGVQWLGNPPVLQEAARLLGVNSMLSLPAAGAA